MKTPRYSIATMESPLGYTISRATAINDRGQVIGHVHYGDVDEVIACLWKDGKVHELGQVTVNKINNKGQIVGCRCGASSNFYPSAVLCENQCSKNLFHSNTPISDAEDINDAVQVVGYAQTRLSKSKKPGDIKRGAFLWECGKRRYLEVPEGYRADKATAINNKGTIIGNVRDTNGEHAVVWQKNSVSLLGAPENFQKTHAEAVNDLDQILVRAIRYNQTELSDDDYEIDQKSFLWQEGQWQVINDMGLAHALNNQGQVVGWIGAAPKTAPGANERGDTHAAFWENGKALDLNDVVPERSGWLLERAVDINNCGQIVGNGVFEGKSHAFLLTPELL